MRRQNSLHQFVVAAGFAIVIGSGSPAFAEETVWTGWLGPQRNGWVASFRPPTEWPEELEEVWQVEVGTGYGTPLVSGGRVYQHARQGDDEVLWCLDLATGETIWHERYAAPFKIGGGGERHGKGPKSCPALADGRVFTLSISGLLSAWDAETGERLWHTDFGDRFEQTHPYWGASTSPLIDQGRVIVHFGGDEQGALIALDADSGEVVWSQGSDGASYASPILVEIDGVRQIVELNMRAIVGVESESGEALWEYPYPQVETDQNMVTPAFHDGLVLQGGENRGILALEPRLTNDGWSVEPRWHQEQVALDMSTAVINDGLLFGFSHYGFGRLFCLNPENGDVLWEGPRRTGENVTFLSVPGHVLALADNGTLQVIAADQAGYERVAMLHVAEGQTWAPPVLLESGLLVKDLDTLARWSLPTADSRRDR